MHPQQVAEFSLLCDTEEEESGVWISKAWLKGIDHDHENLACVIEA